MWNIDAGRHRATASSWGGAHRLSRTTCGTRSVAFDGSADELRSRRRLHAAHATSAATTRSCATARGRASTAGSAASASAAISTSTPIRDNRAVTQEFDFTATPRRAAQRRQRRGQRRAELRTARGGLRDRAGRHAARRRATIRFTRYPRVRAARRTSASCRVQPSVEWGGFLSGHRTRAWCMGVGVRPRPGVTVNLAYELELTSIWPKAGSRRGSIASSPTRSSARSCIS